MQPTVLELRGGLKDPSPGSGAPARVSSTSSSVNDSLSGRRYMHDLAIRNTGKGQEFRIGKNRALNRESNS